MLIIHFKTGESKSVDRNTKATNESSAENGI